MCLQEWVGLPLVPDGGGGAVPRDDQRIVGERQELVPDRGQELPPVSARKVRAPDAVAEQRVARDQLLLGRNIQADAAWRVPRRMEHVELDGPQAEHVAILRAHVDIHAGGDGHSEPGRLHLDLSVAGQSGFVQVNRGAGGRLHLRRRSHVVEVGMREHDRLHAQPVMLHHAQDLLGLIAGIDDHALPRDLIAEDRAVARQHPQRQNLVDHRFIVYSGGVA